MKPAAHAPAGLDIIGAAHGLVVDALAAELMEECERAGAGPILLKGASLADWLYADEGRRYGDCDILIDPDFQGAVSRLLTERGFEAFDPPRARPGLRHTVATAWVRAGAAVDVHLSFWGIGVAPKAAWSILSACTERAQVARRSVAVLTPPGRLVLIALHAAHDGRNAARPMEDLERALRVASQTEWIEAARIARALGAEGAFVAGLRLTSSGVAKAAELELPSRPTLASALATAGLPMSDGYERLARAQSPGELIGVIFGELIPSREFMRWRYRMARRGLRGLLASYLLRGAEVLSTALRAGTSWVRLKAPGFPFRREGWQKQP